MCEPRRNKTSVAHAIVYRVDSKRTYIAMRSMMDIHLISTYAHMTHATAHANTCQSLL